MSNVAKGLYAPRIVDAVFAVMGAGSAVLLFQSDSLPIVPRLVPDADFATGPLLLAAVVLIAGVTCLYHRIDRRGWDDYMGQVVTQSAMIAVVTVILSGVVFDFVLVPNFGLTRPEMMVHGLLPIACLSWAIGYFFLRKTGTGS